jgi:hypothetical protein
MKTSIALRVKKVSFGIKEMEEKYRNKGLLFTASNGIEIQSTAYPELRENTVYVQGSLRDADARIATIEFDTAKEAEEYHDKIHVALKEWMKS